MQKQTKQQKPLHNRHRILPLMLLLVAVALSVTFIVLTVAADQPTVTVTFSDGVYRVPFLASTTDPNQLYQDTGLFEDVKDVAGSLTAAGCIIVPGTSFADTVGSGILASASDRLDPETFYLGEADESGNRWAYTFVGWKIRGAADKLPSKTVFQPGDVITESVIQELLEETPKLTGITTTTDGAGNITAYHLEMEALWARCYFIQNPYHEMVYTYGIESYGTKQFYALDTEASNAIENNRTTASDSNVGNDPALPKATIYGLFDVLRPQIYTDKTMSAYDAYEVAVMLVGDLDYMTDTNYRSQATGSAGKIYGQKTTYDAKTAYVSATYKSLVTQNTPAEGYTYYYKPKGNYNAIYGNLRFDNIVFNKKDFSRINSAGKVEKQTAGTEFQLYYHTSHHVAGPHYMEMTARFSENAITTFRPDKHDLVVANAGNFTFHTTHGSAINRPNDTIEWFAGRKARITNFYCGLSTAYAGDNITVTANFKIQVTGGSVSAIYGSGNGEENVGNGKRTIYIYGDPSRSAEYNPTVGKLYGGAMQGLLYGDVDIKIDSCNNVTNVFGGGRDFTAYNYGNVSITIIDSTIKGKVYGGGEYGNTLDNPKTENTVEGKSTIRLYNSTVAKDLYGGGMGQTQPISITEIRTAIMQKPNGGRENRFIPRNGPRHQPNSPAIPRTATCWYRKQDT